MQRSFDDTQKDELLGIRTTGRDDTHSDTFRYPYEPTSYEILDRIADSGYITGGDFLIDYGCGKGRVPIYMNYKTGCRACGIEMMQEFIDIAQANLSSYNKTHKHDKLHNEMSEGVEFINAEAEKYIVPSEATSFFFFNPFSIEIMKRVMKRILDSYYVNPRHITMFFYYPSDEYIAFLMNVPELSFVDEIDCTDIAALEKSRNVVMVFEI